MKYGDTVDLAAINELVERGLVSVSTHDKYPLKLYNYTQAAQN